MQEGNKNSHHKTFDSNTVSHQEASRLYKKWSPLSLHQTPLLFPLHHQNAITFTFSLIIPYEAKSTGSPESNNHENCLQGRGKTSVVFFIIFFYPEKYKKEKGAHSEPPTNVPLTAVGTCIQHNGQTQAQKNGAARLALDLPISL